MSSFSKSSQDKLDTCHPDLQRLFTKIIEKYDCTILCGHRNKEDQDQAVAEGKSKVAWPNSKHNTVPSNAIDAAPFPLDWKDTSRFYHFAGYVLGIADFLGIKIRYGGDWNGNLQFRDEKFQDLPHFELIEESK